MEGSNFTDVGAPLVPEIYESSTCFTHSALENSIDVNPIQTKKQDVSLKQDVEVEINKRQKCISKTLDFVKRRSTYFQQKDEHYYNFYVRCFNGENNKIKAQENFIMGLNFSDFDKLTEIIFFTQNINQYDFINRRNYFYKNQNETCSQFYNRCFDSSEKLDINLSQENFILGLSLKQLRQLSKILESENYSSMNDAVQKLSEIQNIKCYYCEKNGHKEFQCFKKKKDFTY